MRGSKLPRQAEHIGKTDRQIAQAERHRDQPQVAEEASGNEQKRGEIAKQRFPINKRGAAAQISRRENEHRPGKGEKASDQPTPKGRWNIETKGPIEERKHQKKRQAEIVDA